MHTRVFFLAIWGKIAPKFIWWHQAYIKKTQKMSTKSPSAVRGNGPRCSFCVKHAWRPGFRRQSHLGVSLCVFSEGAVSAPSCLLHEFRTPHCHCTNLLHSHLISHIEDHERHLPTCNEVLHSPLLDAIA